MICILYVAEVEIANNFSLRLKIKLRLVNKMYSQQACSKLVNKL
jgi:hypothetical protein